MSSVGCEMHFTLSPYAWADNMFKFAKSFQGQRREAGKRE